MVSPGWTSYEKGTGEKQSLKEELCDSDEHEVMQNEVNSQL